MAKKILYNLTINYPIYYKSYLKLSNIYYKERNKEDLELSLNKAILITNKYNNYC